jgi:hypothetical protein
MNLLENPLVALWIRRPVGFDGRVVRLGCLVQVGTLDRQRAQGGEFLRLTEILLVYFPATVLLTKRPA